ncbi:MAG: toll/interleukin-1 receptor domain-containing protein [Gammaproteobacteria bacterium]
MNYEYHVFISYARGDLWTDWVKNIFAPRLNGYLNIEVGQLRAGLPSVFYDDQIKGGADWEAVLRRCLARSTIMISLFSAQYFQSEWCRREMALMLERQKQCGMGAETGENYGLVIPLRLGDGDHFPDMAKRAQVIDFEPYANPDLLSQTDRASEFNTKIQDLAKLVATTLQQAQPCCEEWLNLTGEEFIDALEAKPINYSLPRLRV